MAFQAVRYTGGTKTGVKGLATINNDACTNKNSTRKECYINHLRLIFNYLIINNLLPDAKMRKYGTQNFVGADFAYDFA